MKEKGGMHILDALENLNTLVEADSLEEIEITDDIHLVPHKKENRKGREIYWVKAGSDEHTLDIIKNTFHSVYIYLQNFYSNMKKNGDPKRLIEGINTIMVLVGEAAKNLEKLGTLFTKRINEFEEYKQLQNFYRNRVIKESFQAFAQLPIPKEDLKENLHSYESAEGFTEIEDEIADVSGVHILNDLEVIKRDHHYELFFLKNEAGNNFYTYELARTIKLACDFGEFAKEYFGDDPLLQIKNWEDKSLHLLSQSILKNCKHSIEKFYKESMKYKGMDLVINVHNALMALMLAANPRNLIRQFSLKGCHLYFNDFLMFLRESLNNREYQKFLIYSTPPGKTFFQDMLDLIHSMCFQLFTTSAYNDELKMALTHIIEKTENTKNILLSEMLNTAYTSLFEALKKHPNGVIFKAVDIIRDQTEHIFDPLHQGNIPSHEWSIIIKEQKIKCLRIPCPIMQDTINKAYVIPEFKTFVGNLESNEHLLFINFQDRTSWKEHARSIAIEELGRHAEFADGLTVVTLAKDTDFYNQSGLYHEVSDAEVFIDHFHQHLNDEITGYHFPLYLKKLLFPKFMNELLNLIHIQFFESKNDLIFIERLNFIELAYHFIELKLLEIIQPTYLAFGSKDSLDISATTNVGFIALLTVGKNKKWSSKEQEKLITLLFGQTLMNRERVIDPERFERLVSLIHLLEEKGNYLKGFTNLYDTKILNLAVEF